MSQAQQQVQQQLARPQAQQQQQQSPWWAGPLQGVGSALQGLQHNMQALANSLPKPPGGPMQQQPATAQHSNKPHGPHHGGTLPQGPPWAGAVHHSAASPVLAPPAAAAAAHLGLRHHSKQQPQPVTKEELGRATWVFLHTLAAQFPERPSRQQQKDARQLVDSLTRIYPCADCAQHFQEIVRRDPPDVSSRATFTQWMCRVHNTVNRRLDKPTFNCDLVGARWAPLDCDEHNSCDMTVGRPK